MRLAAATRGGLLATFTAAITVGLDVDDLAVVGDPVDERDDACGIREDSRPVLECEIRRDQNGPVPVVARVDDAIEQVGSVIVVGEIADSSMASRSGRAYVAVFRLRNSGESHERSSSRSAAVRNRAV